jgi:hypothetical protein
MMASGHAFWGDGNQTYSCAAASNDLGELCFTTKELEPLTTANAMPERRKVIVL